MFRNPMKELAYHLFRKIYKKIRGVKPDVTVGDNYLKRWHLIPENRFFNIYYHEIRASDLDRHLHDHPYFFSSFILGGGYIEHTEKGAIKRGAGSLNLRTPWMVHRLEMLDESGANTIFITGPKMRKWGFKTEDGWEESTKYLEKYGIQDTLMPVKEQP